MNCFIHRFIAALAAALLLPVAARAASAKPDEIVQMAPFKVTEASGDFELEVRLDEKKKVVKEMVVSWVGTKAGRFGPRVGDRLVSIDDKPVKGLTLDDVVGLRGRQMKAGETQKLVFTGVGSTGGSRTCTWISRGLRPSAIMKSPPVEIPTEKPD